MKKFIFYFFVSIISILSIVLVTNIIRNNIQEALDEVENFGRDARSIKNTLQNIKDPDSLKDSISENSNKIKAIK